METISNLLLVSQLVLFTLFMANLGRLLVHLLINDDANN
jgi:hypothetical protein